MNTTRCPPARFAARRCAGAGDRELHRQGVLWQAFDSPDPRLLLIDEIDKADIEFPNDLLRELDRMEFFVYETRQTVGRAPPAAGRDHVPTNEKELPDAFCALLLPLHQVPDKDTMQSIVDVHFPELRKELPPERNWRCSSACATCRD